MLFSVLKGLIFTFIILLLGHTTIRKDGILEMRSPIFAILFCVILISYLWWLNDDNNRMLDNYEDMVSELLSMLSKSK
jgi:hypothetical protein